MPQPFTIFLSTKRQFSLLIALAVLGIIFFCFYPSENALATSSNLQHHKTHRIGAPLSNNDFEHHLQYHQLKQANRFPSQDAWRPADVYQTPIEQLIHDSPLHRPHILPIGKYRSKAEYLRQPIIADYAKHSEKVFLMMKEGATVLWQRIPTHLFTTFTKVPYFSIYADAPASIGGYEVIDILANLSRKTLQFQDFKLYKTLTKMRSFNVGIDPSELNLQGGWDLDKYKNIPMLAHALKVAPTSVEWFVFMDGDTYLFMDNLMNYLQSLDSSEPLYLGSLAFFNNKPFAHGGSGVAISRAALEKSLGLHPEWVEELEVITSNTCCGDYMVANMLERANISLSDGPRKNNVGKMFQGQPQWNLAAGPGSWCQKVVSFHHLSSYEVETLWEYERLLGPEKRSHITYGDIYRDFVAPHIEEYMEEWNSMASTYVYSEANDLEDARKKAEEEEEKKKEQEENKDIDEKEENKNDEKEEKTETDDEENKDRPWMSVELCKKTCESSDTCLSWRYLPDEKYCGLGDDVRLGRPTIKGLYLQYFEDDKDLKHRNTTSGYMIDRIRKMRRRMKCDPIYSDSEQRDDAKYLKKIKDGKTIDRFEGWYRRMQAVEMQEINDQKRQIELEWDRKHGH